MDSIIHKSVHTFFQTISADIRMSANPRGRDRAVYMPHQIKNHVTSEAGLEIICACFLLDYGHEVAISVCKSYFHLLHFVQSVLGMGSEAEFCIMHDPSESL